MSLTVAAIVNSASSFVSGRSLPILAPREGSARGVDGLLPGSGRGVLLAGSTSAGHYLVAGPSAARSISALLLVKFRLEDGFGHPTGHAECLLGLQTADIPQQYHGFYAGDQAQCCLQPAKLAGRHGGSQRRHHVSDPAGSPPDRCFAVVLTRCEPHVEVHAQRPPVQRLATEHMPVEAVEELDEPGLDLVGGDGLGDEVFELGYIDGDGQLGEQRLLGQEMSVRNSCATPAPPRRPRRPWG